MRAFQKRSKERVTLKTGLTVAKIKPIPVKQDGRRAWSLSALGLHSLRKLFATFAALKYFGLFQQLLSPKLSLIPLTSIILLAAWTWICTSGTSTGSSSTHGPGSCGNVPAAAAAAGFTTCAANYDFTTPFYGTLSNWLDCAGALSPQWFLVYGHCSSVTVTTDQGTQVLHVNWHPAELPGINNTVIRTQPNGSGGSDTKKGTTFPQGMYIEITLRVPRGTQNACPPGQSCILTGVWEYSNTSNAVFEWDFIETYGNSKNGAQAHAPGGSCCANIPEPWHVSGYNPSIYNTYGMLITTDGINADLCLVLNGKQTGGSSNGCASKGTLGNGTNNPGINRNYLIMTSGPQSNMNYVAATDLMIKSIRVWECAGWRDAGVASDANHQCNGAVITRLP